MKKICYVVVMSTRKLRHYFEAHRVRVLTNQWLNNIFRNRDSSGRIGKWAMELAEHVIDFEKMSYLVFMPNKVLIVCMTQDQLFHTYGQKCSQITKCHE
jgi:hypothetical protein